MKISIIGGSGRIGSSVAYTLLLSDIKIDEIILEDIVDNVYGEELDLQQAAAGLNKKIKIKSTKDLKDCENSDIVIIAAGVPLSKEKTFDRYKTLEQNKKMLDFIFEIYKDNKKTIYLITTNPIDTITYLLNKKIKDKKRVIGISTITDTSRMNTITKGYMIGEHAGHMIPIEGKVSSEEITELGNQVVKLKGGTWFTTPIGIMRIVKSIVNDEKKQFPISVLLNGEYGFDDVCLSVPCIIGKDGIEKIIEIDLNRNEKEILRNANESVKKAIKSTERQETLFVKSLK
jgi:malate/lactate dehydrogenase